MSSRKAKLTPKLGKEEGEGDGGVPEWTIAAMVVWDFKRGEGRSCFEHGVSVGNRAGSELVPTFLNPETGST